MKEIIPEEEICSSLEMDTLGLIKQSLAWGHTVQEDKR